MGLKLGPLDYELPSLTTASTRRMGGSFLYTKHIAAVCGLEFVNCDIYIYIYIYRTETQHNLFTK
jgi:hypothetical protein